MKTIFKQTLLVSLLILMMTSCKDDEVAIDEEKQFGLAGAHSIETFTASNYDFTTIYYPADIATMPEKSPVVFLTSGWFGRPEDSQKYKSLLQFVASHGYTIIYTDEGSVTDPQFAINAFETMLSNEESGFVTAIAPYIDTTKIGVIGHSAGGGTTLTTLKYYSSEDKNYGTNGRFIMALDPWYAFGMSEDDIRSLPSNTNVIFLKFGERGFNIGDDTDPRIVLTEYSLLASIASTKKDYQVYNQENANHSYPIGNRPYAEMQGILKPLDALLDYTFVEQSERTRVVALENGNDDPYDNGNGIQIVKPKTDYHYTCDGSDTIIDYCAIIE